MASILSSDIQADLESISKIDALPSILEVICRSTGMGFAAVARVTEDRWVACAVRDDIQFGLVPGGELKLETTICHEIRQHQRAVIIDHVLEDKRYCMHATPAMYGFQSYISVPIKLRDGSFFGTLCAIDPNPARLDTPETIGMFNLFADLIAFHLDAIEQLALSELKLLEERKTAELREQFIAILGHDLRNPVGTISNAAQLLLRMQQEEAGRRLATIVQDSSFRMRELIDNILDFASGRLGGGIALNRDDNAAVENILRQVITELSVIWPERLVETEFDITGPINCDSQRVAQLFSNLLSNALIHGNKDAPVDVRVTGKKGELTIAVSNPAKRIPDEVMGRLFEPFFRGDMESGREGLGLGLYIASEIARVHGGSIEACSTEKETRFTLHIPAAK